MTIKKRSAVRGILLTPEHRVLLIRMQESERKKYFGKYLERN